MAAKHQTMADEFHERANNQWGAKEVFSVWARTRSQDSYWERAFYNQTVYD
jgi:hypothetical protein